MSPLILRHNCLTKIQSHTESREKMGRQHGFSEEVSFKNCRTIKSVSSTSLVDEQHCFMISLLQGYKLLD